MPTDQPKTTIALMPKLTGDLKTRPDPVDRVPRVPTEPVEQTGARLPTCSPGGPAPRPR